MVILDNPGRNGRFRLELAVIAPRLPFTLARINPTGGVGETSPIG
jgi:hypothetical protein